MDEIKVLDCTLRDGGYINDWKFGENNIKGVISHLTCSKIDFIECGFLSNKIKYDKDSSKVSDISQFSRFIPLDRKNSKYICMINYGEYSIQDIPNYDGTSVNGIRVTFHKNERKNAIEFCKKIKEKGYMIFIQPMITNNYSDKELLELVEEFNNINPYAFYIVDSFGIMKRNDLLRMYYLIHNNLNQNIYIGYHSHNNLQLAYSNAQSLVELHTSRKIIIDSSVFGMGRGAGNLNTELFVEYLNESLNNKYIIYPLLQIIDETLNKIYHSNYWGYSLPHYLSSVHNCHPNYASYLDNKNTLTIKSIEQILSAIPTDKKENFCEKYIEELYFRYQKNYINDKEMINKLSLAFSEKNIIIIAPGKSIEKNRDKIIELIEKKDTVAISINFIPDEFNCDFNFISNEKRFESLLESNVINLKKTKLILTSNISERYSDCLVVNYIDLLNNTYAVGDNATLMLLKLLVRLKVKEVFIAGFDGYNYDNKENYVNDNMILTCSNETIKKLNNGIKNVLNDLNREIKIKFITPTKYFDAIEIERRRI